MRNVFDQFQHDENRLTHALMSSLHEDSALMRRFIDWAIGEPAPKGQFTAVEQSLPGQEDDEDWTEEQPKRGLPDGWIYNDDGWALLIESKINCPFDAKQIGRHRATAQSRGFTPVHIVALVTELPVKSFDPDLKILRWTDLYTWLKAQPDDTGSGQRLYEYMDLLDAKLVAEGKLTEGTLTVFTGVPFHKEHSYSYLEAKRVLRLAMDKLRLREDLRRELGVDPNLSGRGAITGKDSSSIWDYLRLAKSAEAKTHTEFPHLTLGLHREYMQAIVTLPNALRGKFRRNLLGKGPDAFVEIFSEILDEFHSSLSSVAGAVPWMEVIQRRYPAQRAEPFVDALLEFDLRSAFPAKDQAERSPKLQPQWLKSVSEALSDKNANLQLAAGVRFHYDRCPEARTPAILDHVAHAWLACAPLIDTLLG